MSLGVRIKRIQQLLETVCDIQTERAISQLLSRPRYQDIRRLNRFECKVFSQSGEDGILREIFRRIGTSNRVFAECAPGNGFESNTCYLIALGWKGLWIENDRRHVRSINSAFSKKLRDGTLSLRQAFATAENIRSLLDEASIPKDFDLLSIDIDRNDYWVWRGVESYNPRVVVIEYNSIFPPGTPWVVPYVAQAEWDRTSDFGASLTSMELLGKEKGYKLVACTLAGTNAFFVREDLVQDHFCSPFTAENHYEPPRYYLTSQKAGHPRRLSFSLAADQAQE